MRIEKWKLENKEVDVPVLGEDEIETNEEIDKTKDLTEELKNIGEENGK